MAEPTQLPVKYIFRRPKWKDTIYGTGLEFEIGQTRVLPRDLALKFLRHTDTFELDEEALAKGIPEPTPEQVTAEAVALQAKKKEDDEAAQAEVFQVHDQIERMGTKEMVAEFALTKYNIPLDKRHTLEALRAEAKGLVDRFGVM